MKKTVYVIIFLLILFLTPSVSMPQTTNEIDINKLLNVCYAINENQNFEKMPLVIDYSIEILKKAPNSLNAIITISFISTAGSYYKKPMQDKFLELYNKYYPNTENTETDIVEKLVLAELLNCGYSINGISENEAKISSKEGKRILQNFIDNCSNKDYSALGILFLACDNSNDESIKLYETFMNKFPEHKAMPIVEFRLLLEKYFYNEVHDYLKCIDELKKLVEKYKNIDSPLNSVQITAAYYDSISKAYLELGNIGEAKTYLEIIKKETPDYRYLNMLEQKIKRVSHK